MTDNNNGTAQTPSQGKVELPKPPKQDIWGRDLPLPNVNQKQDDEKRDKLIVNSIEKVVAENSEIFSDIVKQFKTYTDSIRSSNQNFLLKQGRVMLAEMRKSFLETMADEAGKSGDEAKAGTVNYTLRVVTNNLDRLIKEQEEANKAVRDRLDKANKTASDNLQTVQADSKENEKDRKARANAEKKAEIARKRKDAEDRENEKEGKLLKGIKKFIFGQTAAERREEAKNKPKRSGGLLDSMGLDFSFSGILSMITKIGLGAAGLFAVLGTKGTEELFTKLAPVFGTIIKDITEQIIEPMIQTIFSAVKNMISDSIANSLGVSNGPATGSEPPPIAGTHDVKRGPEDAQWLADHPAAIATRGIGRGMEHLYDFGNLMYDRWMKMNDIKHGFIAQPQEPVILNSNEYDMQQQAENGAGALAAGERKARSLDEAPLPYLKPEIDKNPLSKADMLTAKMAQEDEAKARASRIYDAQNAKLAREDALPQSFKDSVNNFFGTVAKKLDDERKKEKADIADKKSQLGNAFGSWADSLESTMHDTFKSFYDAVSGGAQKNAFQSMLDSMDSLKHNDFSDMVDSMDKYKATTNKMKAASQMKQAPTPIIVQAPSTVNQSTTVSNGTTINSSVSVGNNRKFLGR